MSLNAPVTEGSCLASTILTVLVLICAVFLLQARLQQSPWPALKDSVTIHHGFMCFLFINKNIFMD